MTRFAAPLLLVLLAGCPTSSGVPPAELSDCGAQESAGYDIVDNDTGGAGAAWIEGDTLSVSVAYGGGCEEHLFSICWDGAFAESDPVQVDLSLWHGGTPDMCEAMVYETRTFDLAPLKDAWHAGYGAGAGTITVHLEGAPDLEYSFE